MTVLLLAASNAFMTFAWYFHVRKRAVWPLAFAIGVSWFIALPEYLLQVPANRYGHAANGGSFTLPQLKILQEAVTLVVFAAFSILVAREKIHWRDAAAFALIFAAVVVSMAGRSARPEASSARAAVDRPAG